ncbi:tachykinin-like peptides receptor 99D isoform X2 [Exaiptasia diaphana]|nr:tachykinin-like peptides receptor 99D isoform X2 [Exaiptasia diaphana]
MYSLGVKVSLTMIYVITFFVGFIGNSIGMYVVCRRTCITNVTNIFIANMSLADLIITILAVPTSVVQLYVQHQWIGGFFGTFTCKVTFFSLYMSLAASVFTIVLISVERYAAIFYPLRGDDVKKPKIITGMIWLLSFAFASPMLIVPNVNQNPTTGDYNCIMLLPGDPTKTFHVLKIYFTLCFVVMYIAPLLFLGVVYSRVSYKLCMRASPNSTPDNHSKRVRSSRRKVVKMLVGIVVVFSFCWLPAHIMHYLIIYQSNVLVKVPPIIILLSFWLCQANSSINPCLYIMLNDRFRHDFGRAISHIIRKVKSGFSFSFESSPSCFRRRNYRSNSSSSNSYQRRLSLMLLLQAVRGTFNSPSGRPTGDTKVTRNSLSALNHGRPFAETRF